MVRREIAPTSQALQVAFFRLFREPMLSESTSFGSRWGIYEMNSRHHDRGRSARRPAAARRRDHLAHHRALRWPATVGAGLVSLGGRDVPHVFPTGPAEA